MSPRWLDCDIWLVLTVSDTAERLLKYRSAVSISPPALQKHYLWLKTAALSLACWLVRRVEKMTLLKAQPLLAPF